MSYAALTDSMENALDDDKEKSAIEKMVDKVNDAVENIVNTASAAAMKAMEPKPSKPGEEAITYMRMDGDGFVSDPLTQPMATMPVVIPRKKRAAPKKTVVKAAAPVKSAKKPTKKKTAKKIATKATKEAAKKSSNKSAKKKKKAKR
jgi:hypothetical protein